MGSIDRNHRAARATCLALLVLALTGCGRHHDAPAKIRIGFLADKATPIAEAMTAAARLAVETVNAEGGIDVGGRSHTLVLLIEDTGSTPEGTTRACLKLINQDKVVAIVGSSFSRNAIPSGKVAERAGVPMISPGSTHPQTTEGRRFVFRVAFVDSFQGRVMARLAAEDLGLTTAAVLYDVAESYSRSIAEVFRQAFETTGRVVAYESFTSGEQDFTRQLERIRDARPEALFLPNFSKAVILQSRQARALGIDAVLLGSDGWLVDGLEKHRDLEGAFFIQSWHRDIARVNAASEEFIARYENAYGRQPDEPAALTYDAFGLLFEALTHASRPDPKAIREALSAVEGYPGLTGPITYRDRGGDPRKNAVIVRIEQGELRLFKLVDAPPEK